MDFTVAYKGRSGLTGGAAGMALSFAPNLRRDRVSFVGDLRWPLRFREAMAACPEVLECHHVVGPYSYLLKVKVEDTAALEDLLSRRIKSIGGVSQTVTIVVLSTSKEETAIDIPLPREAESRAAGAR